MFLLTIILQFMNAPYGRFNNSKNSNPFNFTINGRYGFVLLELPTVIIPPLLVIFVYGNFMTDITLAFIIIFEIHYIQRTFIYPLCRMQRCNPTTITTVLLGFAITTINSYLCTKYTVFWNKDKYFRENPDFAKGRLFVGICLFFYGFYINVCSDSILLNLRKPGELGYRIPRGQFFE